MPAQKPPYLLIGTVTKDILPDGSFNTGGTPTYASAVINNLDWQAVIVTAVSEDFNPPPHMVNDEWHIVPSPETTTYQNIYTEESRKQIIGPIGRPIHIQDIPAECRDIQLVHLCPLAQDVNLDIIPLFKDAFLVTTLQGWLRKWNDDGVISMRDWQYMAELLTHFKAVVVSLEDVANTWRIAEEMAALTPILIVTQGSAGCTIFHQGQRFKVPGRPAHIVDYTGAGDVFAATFFVQYYLTNNLRQSVYFANVAASMALEKTGAAGAPTLAEIEAYIAQNPLG